MEINYTGQGFEMREHEKFYGHSRSNGRSTCEINCPFCGLTVTAYIWSLAGGGKRCDCGVIHSSFGQTIDNKNIYKGQNEEEGKKMMERRHKQLGGIK